MDQDPLKSRPAAEGDAAATPGSPSRPKTAAERKRDQRARERAGGATEVGGGGKAGGRLHSLGNRFRWDFGPLAKAGESVSAKEAEEQLYHAHVAAAKVMRSEVDMTSLKEEFEVAGESFATVANHIWPPLRLLIRFIAPLVLAGALIAIWAAILAETPWVRRLGEWWTNREREQPAQPPPPPAAAAEPWSTPHVVQPPHSPAPEVPQAEQAPHPPVPNVRAMRQR